MSGQHAVTIRRTDLAGAMAAAGLTEDRAELVWERLAEAAPERTTRGNRLDATNVLVYLGAIVTIAGLVYFGATAWASYGAGGMLAISVAYGLGFLVGGLALIERGWTTPGGLSITAAVCMAPVSLCALLLLAGAWTDSAPGGFDDYHSTILSQWVALEAATIAAAAVALRHVRFSFLVAPLAFSVWYLSMDLSPLLLGEDASDASRAVVSIAVGLLAIGMSFALAELRGLRGHAFWGYLAGLSAVFGALAFQCFETASAYWWLTGAGGLVCLVVAVALDRRVFAVFGGLALFAFVSYLSSEVFAETDAALPFVLSAAGIGIVACGMAYERRQEQLRAALLDALPPTLSDLISDIGAARG